MKMIKFIKDLFTKKAIVSDLEAHSFQSIFDNPLVWWNSLTAEERMQTFGKGTYMELTTVGYDDVVSILPVMENTLLGAQFGVFQVSLRNDRLGKTDRVLPLTPQTAKELGERGVELSDYIIG